MSVKPLSTYAPHSHWTSPAISDRIYSFCSRKQKQDEIDCQEQEPNSDRMSTRKLLHIPHATLMVISVLLQLGHGNWKSLPSELRHLTNLNAFKDLFLQVMGPQGFVTL